MSEETKRGGYTSEPEVNRHTAGPWTVDLCVDANGHEVIRRDDGSEHGNTIEQPIATVYYPDDARRIVAAVNAVEGVSTKALEDGVVLGLLEAAEAAINEYFQGPSYAPATFITTMRRLRDAVTKAKS